MLQGQIAIKSALNVQIGRNQWFHLLIFGAWLNNVFNKFDKSRVEDVGADIACAEWLLRCGAHVKFVSSDAYHTDYNTLPKKGTKGRIAAIDATESCISVVGFPYLEGLRHVREVKFHKCDYINDQALAVMVRHLKTTLECLHISSCGCVTDSGVMALADLAQLKNLHLSHLISVQDLLGCGTLLREGLPHCKMDL